MQLERQLRPYRRHHPDARWTRPESWHLTLLFLGSVAPDRVPELTALVDGVAVQRAPYVVRAGPGGGREQRGEGVAWLALGDGAGALIEVASRLAASCPPDISGGRPPRRTPSAHLTVARRAERALIEALRTEAHGTLHVTWTVASVDLVRSHLGPDGARYETLHRAAL